MHNSVVGVTGLSDTALKELSTALGMLITVRRAAIVPNVNPVKGRLIPGPMRVLPSSIRDTSPYKARVC